MNINRLILSCALIFILSIVGNISYAGVCTIKVLGLDMFEQNKYCWPKGYEEEYLEIIEIDRTNSNIRYISKLDEIIEIKTLVSHYRPNNFQRRLNKCRKTKIFENETACIKEIFIEKLTTNIKRVLEQKQSKLAPYEPTIKLVFIKTNIEKTRFILSYKTHIHGEIFIQYYMTDFVGLFEIFDYLTLPIKPKTIISLCSNVYDEAGEYIRGDIECSVTKAKKHLNHLF